MELEKHSEQSHVPEVQHPREWSDKAKGHGDGGVRRGEIEK